jgi:hypothetical protein
MDAETLVPDMPEARWRRWQRRGYLQDRRSRLYARVLGSVVFSALAIRLAIQLMSAP